MRAEFHERFTYTLVEVYFRATTLGFGITSMASNGHQRSGDLRYRTRRRGVTLKKWIVLALAAVLALGLVGCGNTSEPAATGTEPAAEELTGSINVEGSDTMVNLGQAWAEVFQTENPGVMISLKGGGSGTGIAALINGTVDFANASRQMKDEEIDRGPGQGRRAGRDRGRQGRIAVVVNPANTVTALTLDQLGKIYRGEITNWKDVGGADKAIVLLSRDSSSGTYEYFKEEVVGKDERTRVRQGGEAPSVHASHRGRDQGQPGRHRLHRPGLRHPGRQGARDRRDGGVARDRARRQPTCSPAASTCTATASRPTFRRPTSTGF